MTTASYTTSVDVTGRQETIRPNPDQPGITRHERHTNRRAQPLCGSVVLWIGMQD
jgi:hypothetical protein